ncbi:MAG: hypothetical protein AAFZ58_08120 [Pseudomonadota bacterium]
MDDLTPSRLQPQNPEAELRDKLLSQQSTLGTLLGSIAGAVPGFALYFAVLSMGRIPIIAYVLPGVAVGLGAKFVGRGIDPIHAWIAAGVTVAAIAACQVLLGFHPLELAFSLPNAFIAGYLGKRSLSLEEDKSLYRYKRGLDEPPSDG